MPHSIVSAITELVQVLAGRMNVKGGGMQFSGEVSIGGSIVDPVAARSNIAYVMQEEFCSRFETAECPSAGFIFYLIHSASLDIVTSARSRCF